MEQKDMSGSLFKNTRKLQDNHPDLTGSVLIEGKDYWLSAWQKVDKNGNKYFSLSLKPKEGVATTTTMASMEKDDLFD
jgi:uncharacterized protein (DUF736 family)